MPLAPTRGGWDRQTEKGDADDSQPDVQVQVVPMPPDGEARLAYRVAALGTLELQVGG